MRPRHRAGSIYDKKGLKVSFKSIDDWTEGTTALASDNVDIIADHGRRVGQGLRQLLEKGFNARAVFMVDWSAAPMLSSASRASQHRRPGRQDGGLRALHTVALPARNGLKEFGLDDEQRI